MAAINVLGTDTLEQFRVKSNTVFGRVGTLTTLTDNAQISYTNVIGINAGDFTGTPARFTIIRTNSTYDVQVTLAGSGYQVGDTVLVKGSNLDGEDSINDATITITEVDPGFGVVGATVAGLAVSDIISEVNQLREEMGSLQTTQLNTDGQTFYDAVNEHEADIGTVENLTTTATNLTDAVNELDAFQGNVVLPTNSPIISGAVAEIESVLRSATSNVTGYALNTSAKNIISAINEHESDIGTVANLGTDAKVVTLSINELETAIRGTRTDYALTTTAQNLVDAVREHESDLGTMAFTPQGASGDLPLKVTYVNLGSTVTSALNSLKAKTDFLADEVGGEMAVDFVGTDNNIISALNNLYAASSISTLNDVYLRRDTQDWVTTGTLRVGAGGIGGGISETSPGVFAYHDFTIKYYNSSNVLTDGIIIKQGSGNIGINKAPGTYKVDVAGSVNASTGFYYGGQDTDARYLRTGGTTQSVATTTNFTGTAQYKSEDLDSRFLRTGTTSQSVTTNTTFSNTLTAGGTLVIGSTTVASPTLTIQEWVEDIVGGMVTGNTETGGISAVYDDVTGKITMAIANNAHTHVSTNISDWTEAVQDTVGAFITGSTHSGLAVTYDDVNNTLDFNVNDPVITIAGEASGSATMTNLSNTTINVTLSDEAIQDRMYSIFTNGAHTGIAASYDDVNNRLNLSLTADPVISLAGDVTGSVTLTNLATQTFTLTATVLDDSHSHSAATLPQFTEDVQDIVGGMVSTNTENGLTVTYDDNAGKLNFDVNDFTVTFGGASSHVTGTFTITDLGSVSNVALTVVNDSHTHDGRYYTESEADARFINSSGDTVAGNLQVQGQLYVGENGWGSSYIHFYDDNSDTWRTLQYDQSNWYVEDDGGTNRLIIHSGNIGSQSVNYASSANSASSSTYSDYTYVERNDSTNATYYMNFSDIGSAQRRIYNDGGCWYNPSSNTLGAGTFSGTATSAKYADLAEKYLADQEYPVGTVIRVGGEKEVTAGALGKRAIGVVSEKPALMMNSELEGGTYIALKGRVPVRVLGTVKKGDELIAIDNGLAAAGDGKSFGVALEDKDYTEEGLIEVVIL